MIKRLKKYFRPKVPSTDDFLRDVIGVIHIGAHEGQERQVYADAGLNVLWVEAMPERYQALQRNIAGFPRQTAVVALLTDREGEIRQFHVASNEGASSSILPLAKHADIWPDVTMQSSIELRSKTLDSILRDEGVDMTRYDALVLDTQGSELLVLKGAGDRLKNIRYIKTEAANFEAYKDCCQLSDLSDYLREYGFVESLRVAFATHPDGGQYFDIVYKLREQ